MKDDWNNPEFAKDWDEDNLRGNPAREEHLGLLLSIIQDNYQKGKKILDLGVGSGQFEALLFQRIPRAIVVGVDASDAMISLAKTRLAGFESQYTILEHDLSEFPSLKLPEGPYQFIVAVQTLHELPNSTKQQIYERAYKILGQKGLFLVMDRIAVDYRGLYSVYESARSYGEAHAEFRSEKNYDEYVEAMESKEDLPATLEDNLQKLREAGFKSACINLKFDRALFAGLKD